MKTRFGFIDPGVIMGGIVALIILGVGIFAFFVTLNAIQSPADFASKLGTSYNASNGTIAWQNITTKPLQDAVQLFNSTQSMGVTGNSVFNIVGVVMIIGAIMAIVGLVYQYVR